MTFISTKMTLKKKKRLTILNVSKDLKAIEIFIYCWWGIKWDNSIVELFDSFL